MNFLQLQDLLKDEKKSKEKYGFGLSLKLAEEIKQDVAEIQAMYDKLTPQEQANVLLQKKEKYQERFVKIKNIETPEKIINERIILREVINLIKMR